MDMNIGGLSYGKNILRGGYSKPGVFCMAPHPRYRIAFRAIHINGEFELTIKRTRIYLTIFGEKKKDTKKYKLDITWNPVNCTIPDELEAQILYLKMKNILT